MCSSLLEDCFEIAQEIKAQEETKNVAHELQPIYDRLTQIRAELENLVLTHRWTLRETDLWNYSLSLQEIDKMRVDGKFVDSEGNRPGGQFVRLVHLARFLALICIQGIDVSAPEVLRSSLSANVLKRTCLRGAHANC
jgi:hypothetical protein